MQVDKLFSLAAAAEYLGGVSKASIKHWIKIGSLARTRVGKRRLMIRQSDLERFVAESNTPQNGRIKANAKRSKATS